MQERRRFARAEGAVDSMRGLCREIPKMPWTIAVIVYKKPDEPNTNPKNISCERNQRSNITRLSANEHLL